MTGTKDRSWNDFAKLYDPLRTDLYRYCRYLTRSPWDAEDLAQDTLARAFLTLGQMAAAPENPRAWLFRVAYNLYVYQLRRRREPEPEAEQAETSEPRASREAAGTLLVRLSPQERAALVLKDVFDFTLEEIAEALSTTPGTVKSALSRGRGKLSEEEPVVTATVAKSALDAFCQAFNARDLERLTALLLDQAAVEVVGVHVEYGPEAVRKDVLRGMLFGSERMAAADKLGGMDPRFIQGVHPIPPRIELRIHRGEALLLSWYAHDDGELVRAITRLECEDDRISRLRNYFFTPDFLLDVCAELGVPCRVNGTFGCRVETA